MTRIHIQFSRFSAFYSPLIATMAGGFLEEEGLEPVHSVSPPGVSAIGGLHDGSVQVAQSAPSQGISSLERGETPAVPHFAQINRMDGFFIAGRQSDSSFTWDKLRHGRILVDHGGQPLAMFKYACHKAGLDFAELDVADAGTVDEIDHAFRAGEGDYVHQQGPAPQQLAHDGVGHVVASVGEMVGACAFSSLAATREWLAGDMARAFMRAYRKARVYVNETPAAEIAAAEAGFFPEVEPAVLTETIAAYQKLGCWAPQVEISPEDFAATLEIFRHAGRITRDHPYDAVVAAPPES